MAVIDQKIQKIQKTRTERLNLRVTESDARLLRRAATETHVNLSSFLIESARLRAEETLASQSHLVYDTKHWNTFLAALDRPAQDKPRLKALLTEPGILDRSPEK